MFVVGIIVSVFAVSFLLLTAICSCKSSGDAQDRCEEMTLKKEQHQ